ncbi:MAG: zraS 4 [Mucilaginibacter sp.]|nr:zraS 4 [Mucilaginibacter sp.]
MFIIWFFMPVVAFAASKADTVIHLDSISKWGNDLNQGWKFHAGDNAAWAEPAFDDSNWQAIFPATPIHFLHEVRKAQIGWFRLRLLISKALRGKTFAIRIYQMGASEIYMNGKLIIQYGKVSSTYAQEQTYNPNGEPLTIQLSDKPEQIIAIRYSYCKQNVYINNGNSAFDMAIVPPAMAWNYYTNYTNYFVHRAFALGIFMILGVLHLAIYVGYRKRKINLYLSLLSFVQSACFMNAFYGNVHNTTFLSNAQIFFYLAAPFAFIFYLTMVYELFNMPKKLLYKLLVALCILIIPFEFLGQLGSTEVVLGSCGIVVYLEITRISIIALRRKLHGAILFFCGHLIGFFCFFAFNYITVFNVNVSFDILVITVDLAFLSPALFLSILLAREFAQNNISLKLKLEEVQRLSEKNLAQELEKQQLLASQNELLEHQVIERTRELNNSLQNLKSTQNQLIQSEKMASLGELTAGIAHEIQNPLNFVNNFSEVSAELTQELKEELRSGHTEDAIAIANDLEQNLGKIKHHGKRADAIVKGMLQHSQSVSGSKEPTNINALANEYMRLSYHGLRAKDKSFNAELVTHFDEKLPKVNVIPQDMGRVMLNLFNNAFYAVNQKQKTAGEEYKPEVSVTTSIEKGQLIIQVKDNGVGILDSIKEKIMQPFFTTKPTGEGTGLGLSLTYDMVVKGHGGSIQVNSIEGNGSEFSIQLPTN